MSLLLLNHDCCSILFRFNKPRKDEKKAEKKPPKTKYTDYKENIQVIIQKAFFVVSFFLLYPFIIDPLWIQISDPVFSSLFFVYLWSCGKFWTSSFFIILSIKNCALLLCKDARDNKILGYCYTCEMETSIYLLSPRGTPFMDIYTFVVSVLEPLAPASFISKMIMINIIIRKRYQKGKSIF